MKTGGRILIFVFVLALIAGCNKKKKEIVEWDITYSGDFVFSDTLKAWQTKEVKARVNSNIDTYLQAHDTRNEYIGEAICSRVTVSVKGPASKDLSILNGAKVKLWATRQAEAGLGQRYNAGPDTIKPSVKQIDLKPNMPNLKNHVMEPFFDVKLAVTTRTTTPPTLTLTTTFTVHVKGINQ
jgi:hypothetical protein